MRAGFNASLAAETRETGIDLSRRRGLNDCVCGLGRHLRSRPRDLLRVARGENLATPFADAASADLAAALLVDDDPPGAIGIGGVAVAPSDKGDQRRPEVEALLSEEVLVAGRVLRVGAALEDLLGDEALQAGGEDVAGNA